ncbi:MAG: T9SS type A sorting domain-containing protein, partial [Saprospiraceae bacterium]|nr:T9SS type A sorting domain-containing protein [Saprospiraceae bacterium]
ALYNQAGQRLTVVRNANSMDVSGLAAGIYFIQNAKGETITLSIQ